MFGKLKDTVGLRLTAGFGSILILMLIVTIIGIQKVDFINETLTTITDINSLKQRYAINFRGSVHDRAIALRDVTLVTDKAQLDRAIADINRLADDYEKSAKLLDEMLANGQNVSPEEKRILQNIKEIERKTLPVITQIIQTRTQQDAAAAQKKLLEGGRELFTEWLAEINRFIDYQEKENQEATREARSVASQFSLLMLSLSSIAIVIGAAVAFFIARGLTRSLGGEPREVAELVGRIAHGDLSTPIYSKHQDSMLAAVSRMQQELKRIFSDLIASARLLSEQADNIGTTSRLTLQAASHQAEASSQAASSLELMRTSIDGVSAIAQQTEQNSSKTSDLSEQGAELVDRAVTEISSISDTVSQSSSQIRMLQQRSEEIGGIANTIKEIADQTNLLALNAAIEAARAGEMGRGFAVVADEVRKLAERTSTATAEISQMIAVIQDETQQAVRSMETTGPQVDKGLKLASEAASMLREIHKQAAESLKNVHEVAISTQQQAQSAHQIAENVEQIARMSIETNDSMQKSATAVEDMENIAHTLKEQVAQYKLG